MTFRTSLIGRIEAERDALQAKVEAMERQKPVTAQSALAEAIIADMQAQHDSELITENDSGEALIRLDGAIAAVEDNFALAQPASSMASSDVSLMDEGKTEGTPSVPEDVMRDAERYRYHFRSPRMEPSKKRPVPPIYLDRSSVAEALSLSESTIEELVRQDRFPKPRKISDRRAGWLMREVMEWAESRPISDLLPVENSARARRAA